MQYNTSKLDIAQLYPLLVGGIIPRPIAWVSTQSSQGIDNLAPYSFFSVASCTPPVLTMTQINAQPESDKDTLRNLKETQECVINIVSTDLAEAMNASCTNYAQNVSEFETLKIAACDSHSVTAKGVAQAKVRYECRLKDVIALSDQPGGGKLMLLDVLHIYVDDTLIQEGTIQSDKLNAVGKLGGNEYTNASADFELARPALETHK
ncbi:flavin reductase family protein [Hydrogenovibrio sp. 3SP14C1]|uniref:flavin reductase family protein n=1 Tax=Hydrogenovibrio sp. 3SP14C1 TaxID=3038774 RepID=UPI002417FB53|nr:flavin reductase family protein [Hydrogenovibrio sp. 3SP14C1]MDG4811979.1 flavin reductase family protein [Hydrogenovibrio sp. 3SP14C1]